MKTLKTNVLRKLIVVFGVASMALISWTIFIQSLKPASPPADIVANLLKIAPVVKHIEAETGLDVSQYKGNLRDHYFSTVGMAAAYCTNLDVIHAAPAEIQNACTEAMRILSEPAT